MCELVKKLSTPPRHPDVYAEVAYESRKQLVKKDEALSVAIPEGKRVSSFLAGIQRALNDPRHPEVFDCHPDAGGKNVIVRRAR